MTMLSYIKDGIKMQIALLGGIVRSVKQDTLTQHDNVFI